MEPTLTADPWPLGRGWAARGRELIRNDKKHFLRPMWRGWRERGMPHTEPTQTCGSRPCQGSLRRPRRAPVRARGDATRPAFWHRCLPPAESPIPEWVREAALSNGQQGEPFLPAEVE